MTLPTSLTDILGADALEALDRPIDEARALPAAAYTDERFFKLEQERVFRGGWIGAAFEHEIPEPGDALPITAAGLPVIVLRDRDGAVRAYHNACRHRGSVVLACPAKGQPTLRCPYHGWTYGLDGALKATPLWDGRKVTPREVLDRSELGLAPIRCEVFTGVIFLDFSGRAPDFATYTKPLVDRFAPYEMASLKFAHLHEAHLAANWKLGIEGALENYHEDFVHPSLPARIAADGEKTFEDMAEGAMFGFCWSGETALRSPTPLIPMKPGQAGPRIDYLAFLFPNTQLNFYGSVSLRVLWLPVSPGVTRIRTAFYLVPEAATAPEYAEARQAMADYWHNLREEDRRAIEGMQIGRTSPAATDFRLSPFWEQSVHHFQKLVIGTMRDPAPRQGTSPHHQAAE